MRWMFVVDGIPTNPHDGQRTIDFDERDWCVCSPIDMIYEDMYGPIAHLPACSEGIWSRQGYRGFVLFKDGIPASDQTKCDHYKAALKVCFRIPFDKRIKL